MKICLVCEGVAATDAPVCASCGGRLLDTDEIHFPVRRGEEDAAHPLLGALVDGKYRVSGVLGRGGMGAVFRATHEVSLVPIALKVLHPRLAGRVEYRTQFLAEARRAGRVLHEHTARVLDVGETQDGSIYIAQELVPGSTLHEWLHAGTPMRPEHVVEILRQVCGALSAAHGVGLVHRDLTPRNIMVDVRDGRPLAKVLDFGIARGGLERAPGGSDDGLSAFASPPYAAPEHLAGLEVDGRADLYGLGVIAYEALSGRVPTAGTTPREFAAATVRGDLLPLTPHARVPRRLARLIGRLLARDPQDRPASAHAVLSELEAIASPRSGRVRMLAVGAMVVAVLGLAFAFRVGAPEPFLRLAPLQELELWPSMPRGVTVTPLRSSKLTPLRFDFGSFDAKRLVLEVWQNNESVAQQPLSPDVQGRTFTLDVRQPEYARVLDTVKGCSEHGPVYLKFVLPGSPPLAYAALRIDDDPPQVEFEVRRAARDGSLIAASSIRVDMTDRQPATLALEVEVAGSKQHVPLGLEGRTVAAYDLLGTLFPPPLPVRDVTLRLVGKDAAGNVAHSETVSCPTIDLGVPSIVRVVGARAEARTLLVGSKGVRLRVQLAGSEPGLAVTFGPMGAPPTLCDDIVEAGLGLDVTWPFPRQAKLPADAMYELVVRDAAGNEARFSDTYAFATERLDHALTVLRPEAVAESVDLAGHAVVAKNGILWDGLAVAFGFQCNVLYRPDRVDVTTAEGGEPWSQAARLTDVGDGKGTVTFDPLRDGRYRMTIHVRAALGGDEQSAEYGLLVRREPVVLRVPSSAGRRFLPQLVELGAIAWQDGALGDGRAWSLEPADARWLRGSIWFGRGRSAPHALGDRAQASDPLLPRLQPWPGDNVLGVCLRDALDRPVRVVCGDQAAPVLTDLAERDGHESDGQKAVELLRFHWHDEAPRARTSEVHVEYGQPARFVVDAPLPYQASDSLELFVDTVPCRPKAVLAARDGGCMVEFELPFDRLQAIARLGSLGPDQFAENRVSAPFTLWLSAPDGRHGFEVRVRTSRTTLEPQRLGEIATSELLPASLSRVLMAPILGPGIGVAWQDPVPLRAEDRATFRPAPALDVRNVADFYLQQHEATRAQYADVMAAIAATFARSEALPFSEIVHHGDPVGSQRLRLVNLVPRVYRGDVAAFEADVRLGPDRAVAGIDFFQAYVFSRAVGWLVAREPNLFRLPTGVELELAAFGSAHAANAGLVLNGAARAGGVDIAASHAASVAHRDGTGWPLTATELIAAGDRVVTELGVEMTGLDFGVREWVYDLPRLATDRAPGFDVSADHARHLEATDELASGRLRAEVERQLLRFGIARGMAIDELAATPGALTLRGAGRWPGRVPGVVRVLQLARDGSGVLAEQPDPHLPVLGVRLCGGRAFLERVRAR